MAAPILNLVSLFLELLNPVIKGDHSSDFLAHGGRSPELEFPLEFGFNPARKVRQNLIFRLSLTNAVSWNVR